MSLLSEKKEEESEATNVVELIGLPGGKGSDSNWLSQLSVGDAFLYRKKGITQHNAPMAFGLINEFRVIFKFPNETKLLDNTNGQFFVWVENDRFSAVNELVRIIGTAADVKEAEQEATGGGTATEQ